VAQAGQVQTIPVRVRDEDQIHVGRIGRMQASRLGPAQAEKEIAEIGVGEHAREWRGQHDRGVTDKGDGDLTGTRMLHPPRLGPARDGHKLSGSGAQKTQRQGQAGPRLPQAARPPPVLMVQFLGPLDRAALPVGFRCRGHVHELGPASTYQVNHCGDPTRGRRDHRTNEPAFLHMSSGL